MRHTYTPQERTGLCSTRLTLAKARDIKRLTPNPSAGTSKNNEFELLDVFDGFWCVLVLL